MAEAIPPPVRRSGPLGVLLVFVLGMVCGAALLFAAVRLARPSVPPGPGPGFGPGAGPPLRRLVRELDLDAAQRDQVRAIIERSRGDVHQVLERSREEIRAILRPEQRERFDRMRPPRPLRGPGGRRGPGWAPGREDDPPPSSLPED